MPEWSVAHSLMLWETAAIQSNSTFQYQFQAKHIEEKLELIIAGSTMMLLFIANPEREKKVQFTETPTA